MIQMPWLPTKNAKAQTEKESMTDQDRLSDKNSSAAEISFRPEPKRRNWIWFALAGLLIVAVVLAGVIFLPGNGTSAEATEADLISLPSSLPCRLLALQPLA